MKYGILFLLIYTNAVFANCGYSLSVSDIVINWTGNEISLNQVISLQRSNSSNSCKDYFITFSTGQSNSYNRSVAHNGGDVLLYNLHKSNRSSSILKDLNDISASEDYISGKTNKVNRSYNENFNFKHIPASNNPSIRGGAYSDSISVKIYSGSLSNPTFEISANLRIIINVPKLINLSLIDSGSSYNPNDTYQLLDFGELEQDETLSFDIRVFSNAGHELYFSSQNSGKLKHQSKVEYIDYSVSVNNVVKSLGSSDVLVGNGQGRTTEDGELYNITVRIGDVDNKIEGTYQDYITVTTTTTE